MKKISISDYIAPGEFSFCGRCGKNETCRVGTGHSNCTSCVHAGDTREYVKNYDTSNYPWYKKLLTYWHSFRVLLRNPFYNLFMNKEVPALVWMDYNVRLAAFFYDEERKVKQGMKIYKMREDLAFERYSRGVCPRFWVEDANKKS